MAGAPPPHTLQPLLKRYLDQRTQIDDWLDWLPLAVAVAESPQSFINAFNDLAFNEQSELLLRLMAPNAGPLADAIIITLAHHAAEIKDDQIRQFLLDDAVTAREHQVNHLRTIREFLEQKVKADHDRKFSDLALANEIVRLEQELSEIRRQEHEQDVRLARLHGLEREIFDLTMRRRVLAAYDEAARRRHLEWLQHEVNLLQKRQEELEADIAKYDKDYESHSRSLSDKQKRLQGKRADLHNVQAELKRLEQQLKAEEAALAEARQQQNLLQAKLKETQSQIKKLEQANRQNEDLLKRESKKLMELQQAAERAGMNDLANRVKEIYDSLPKDLADQTLLNK